MNANPRPWPVIAFSLILAGIMLAGSACRNNSERPAKTTETVTIAYPRTFLSVLCEIARVKGFFEQEGLAVTAQPHEFGKTALESALRGTADVAFVADTPVMFAVTQGRQVSVVGVVSTSRRADAIVGRKDRGILSPRDLRGKRVGVTVGTTSHFFFDSFLAVHRIDRREVKVVDVRPGHMSDALADGKVDAVSTWFPTLLDVRRRLGENGTVFYEEAVYSDMACVAAAAAVVRDRPEVIRRLLRGLVRAERFVKESPGEAKTLLGPFLGLDRAEVDEIWESFDFTVTLDQSLILSLEDQTRWAQRNGLVGAAAMADYRDSIYVDGLRDVKPRAVRIIQ